jgi:uncharacterized protein (TIGR02001 family)
VFGGKYLLGMVKVATHFWHKQCIVHIIKTINYTFYGDLSMAKVKVITLSSVVGALLVAAMPAQADLEGNVAMTTDYIFRGFSQTDQKPAIQGGFDYSHEGTGFYAGIWGSNVELGNSVSIEVDYYMGLSGETGGIGWDLGVIHYDYPSDSAADFDFEEYTVGITYEFLSASYAYSDDFFGATSDEAHYFSLGADFELPMGLSMAVHWGHQMIEDANSNTDDEDYNDWSIGFSKEVSGVGLDVTYHDTSAVSSAFGGSNCDSLCDSRVVFTISKSL